MNKDFEHFVMTPKECGAYLGISECTVRSLCKTGQIKAVRSGQKQFRPASCSADVSDSERVLLQGLDARPGKEQSWRGGWWPAEPDVGRVANGVPARVDRLKCLGNAVVPQQFYPIFKAIAEVENERIKDTTDQ